MALDSGNSPALTMAVYAALTYDIISATNSSPQTTEINAGSRATTLMKWVHIGLIQAAFFGVVGVCLEMKAGRSGMPAMLGTGLAMGLLYAQYAHARAAGLRSAAPGTEH